MAGAVLTKDYSTSPLWIDLVAISEAGKQLLQLDPGISKSYEPQDIHLALFIKFFHHDLLVDIANSNLEGIISLLNNEIINNKLIFPYRFGRLLYDKFNDTTHTSRIEHITAEEVEILLKETPQGVYQVGDLVAGPLGILRSRDSRYVPPVLQLPLWHCSDTGCNSLHQVRLLQPSIPVVLIKSRLSRIASSKFGPASEWDKPLSLLRRSDRWLAGRPYYDLPTLLADTIIGEERTKLLAAALSSSAAGFLRDIIGSPPRKKRLAEGPSDHVASRLSDIEQLQTLLLLDDSEIVQLLDQCVANSAINIPPGELRRSKGRPPRMSKDSAAELSSLGVRSQRRNPLVVLMARIWDAYEAHNLLGELGWRTQKRIDNPSKVVLMDYIREKGPLQTVRELILSSMPITLHVAKNLGVQVSDHEDDDTIAQKIIWKIGLDLPRYSDEYSHLRDRITQFNDILLRTSSIRTENDRAQIRSIGVNLFVSIEHLLEQLISYNVWLLSSDHFLVTKFNYTGQEALQSVSRVLGQSISFDNTSILWDDSGGNTLGSLMSYLSKACDWMQTLTTADRSVLERPIEDLPHFAADQSMIFPFRHKQMWADADQSELSNYVILFARIAKLLAQSNLANIRNGLDHKRSAENFPSLEDMIACVTRIKEALDLADINRFIPKSYWLKHRAIDRFGNEEYLLHDYMDRPLQLRGPTPILGRKSLKFNEPVLIAPGNILDLPNSEIIFRGAEESLYAKYWAGYPRRRTIPSNTGDSSSQVDSSIGDNSISGTEY